MDSVFMRESASLVGHSSSTRQMLVVLATVGDNAVKRAGQGL